MRCQDTDTEGVGDFWRPRGRTADDLGFLLNFFPVPPSSDGTYTARVGGSPGSLILAPADGAR